jgi:branched-subunit amino acid permease
MTLDAIAAVAFGWVIIQTIKSKGVTSKKDIARYSRWIAGIYAILMSSCYLAMGYLGATSSNIAPNALNGGEILTRYAAGEFGQAGQVLLAAITLMACLTTTIGLTNANAQYYKNTYRTPFKISAALIMGLTAIVSNFGLETIIEVSLPAILILCPIAIALILATISLPLPSKPSTTHTVIVLIATFFGTIDALNILDKLPLTVIESLTKWLPFYSAHMSWLVPVFITIVISKLLSFRSEKMIPA